MHAISHTLAHRAPPASRTRARWQPYNSLPAYSSSSSTSSKSSSPGLYSTPPTSVASPNQHTPVCDISPDKLHSQPPTSLPSTAESLRDVNASKNKFALGLVDQAVKTLCEVWRPQDIPAAFTNPRTTKPTDLAAKFQIPEYNALLSSSKHRLTPMGVATPASIPTTPGYTFPSASAAPVLIQPGTSSELRNLVPVRGFVHEVLRRSRTSGCVLQTALCYLEAIRPKIPELARLEKIGQGTNGEPESVPRIVMATEEEIEISNQEEAIEFAFVEGEATVRFGEDEHDVDAMDTWRIDDDEGRDIMAPTGPSMNQRQAVSPSMSMDTSSTVEEAESLAQHITQSIPTSSSTPTPLPHLPSPLLCPRRAFLAALILASKFTQDKCYSNRAWAKLSGLPAREIGRCERALGCALEWRLWVGKAASAGTSVSQGSPIVHRPVVRCQSEPSLNFSSISPPTEPFKCVPASESSASVPETTTAKFASNVHCGSGNRRTIRRASTLPAGVLSLTSRGSQPVSHEDGPGFFSDATSSTLVEADSSETLPSVYLHAPSVIRQRPISFLSSSPSPEMPGLSYSPSSVSSSPSSCSSTGDRTQQLNAFFDDSNSGPNDYFNSPVAVVNTTLLVPGYGVYKPPATMTYDFTIPPTSAHALRSGR